MENIPNINTENIRKTDHFCPTGSTAVLVTDQFQCERLIRAGRVVADIAGTDLYILNIQNNEYPTNPEAIQHLFDISSHNQGAMQLLYSDNAYKTICQYIKNNKVSCVVSGMPAGENSILHKIWGKFTHVHFFTVNDEGRMEEVIHRKTHGIPSKEAKTPSPESIQ